MTTSHVQTCETHPMGRNIYWLTCALALVCGVTALAVSVRVTDGRWVIASLGALFAACGLAMFVRPRTIVDSDARLVCRQFLLFGTVLLLSRKYPFSEFAAVVLKRVRRSNVDNDPDQFFVSLRRHSGRQVLVRYFGADLARQCRPAEELAHSLSSDLEIEIDDHDA